MATSPAPGAVVRTPEETARRADANARLQAELLTRSAEALERSAELVETYADLSRILVRSHADVYVRTERARAAAQRSRALTRSLA